MTTVGDLIKIFRMLIDLFKLLFSKGGEENENEPEPEPEA